jgi:hypothetical protein
MEEVDGLGGGSEVGRLEFPKEIWVQGLWEEKTRKSEAWEKNSESEKKKKKKKKHEKKKSSRINKTS